jgi:glyoxylase-like metal-dependent hydrolase (beta-lactamase superfamily II)
VLRSLLSICLALPVALPALAQSTPQPVRGPVIDFSKVAIHTTRIADDLFVLSGHGGQITALTGPDGVLMVDSQFAPLTDKIVAAIAEVSDEPVRFLVNTHVHADHIGGNENFAKRGALIFGRRQLRCRMLHPSPGPDGIPPPAAPARALPVVTYDAPITLHLNEEDIQLIPIPAAHTDGDTLIRFVKDDVLAVGDYFRSVQYPFVDIFNGGSLAGLLAGLDATLALAGPRTRIIPGHGPIVGRDALRAQRDLLIATRDRMQALIAKGATLEEVLSAHVTEDTDATVPDGPQTAERFVRWLYAELTHPGSQPGCAD